MIIPVIWDVKTCT